MQRKLKNATAVPLIGILLLVASHTVFGQNGRPKGPPPMPTDDQITEMVEDLDKALTLTDEQESKVSKKYFAHFEAVEKKMKAGRPDHEEMKALETEFEKEVNALLSDEQQVLYNAYLIEHKKKRNRHK